MEDVERVAEHDERDEQRQEFPEIKLFLFILFSYFFPKVKITLNQI